MAQSRKKTAAALWSPRTAAAKKAAAARRRRTSLPVVLVQSSHNKKTVVQATPTDSVPVPDQDEGTNGDIDMADHVEGMSHATVFGKQISQGRLEKIDTAGVHEGVLEDVTMSPALLAAAKQTQSILQSTNSVSVHESTTEDITIADAPTLGIGVCEETVAATARYQIAGSKVRAQNVGEHLAISANHVTIPDTNESIDIPGKVLTCLHLKDKCPFEIDLDSTPGTLGTDDCFAICNAEPTSIYKRRVIADRESGVSNNDVGRKVTDNRTFTCFNTTTSSPRGVDTKPANIGADKLHNVNIITSSFVAAPGPPTGVTRSAVAGLAAATSEPEQRSLIVKLRFTARLGAVQAARPGGTVERSEGDVAKHETGTVHNLRHMYSEHAGVSALPTATRLNVSPTASDTGTGTVTITAEEPTVPSPAAFNSKVASKPRRPRGNKVKCITKSTVAVPQTSHIAGVGTGSLGNGTAPHVGSVKIETGDTNPAAGAALNKRVPKAKLEIADVKSAAETEKGVEIPLLVGQLLQSPVVENREAQPATADPKKRLRRTKAQIAVDNAADEAAKSRPIAHKATGLGESSRSPTEGTTSPPATYSEVAVIPGSVEELTQNVSIADPTSRPPRAQKPSIKAREVQGSMRPVAPKTSKFQKTPVLSNALGSSASVVAEVAKTEISTIFAAIDILPTRKRKRETKVDGEARKLLRVGNIEDPSGKAFEGGAMPELTPPARGESKRRARGTSSKSLPRGAEAGPMTEAHIPHITMLDLVAQSAPFKEPALRKGNAPTKKALAKGQAPKRIRTGSTTASLPLGTATCPAAIEEAFLASAPLDLTKARNNVAEGGVCTRSLSFSPKSRGQEALLQQPLDGTSELRHTPTADGNPLRQKTYSSGAPLGMSATDPSIPMSTPAQGDLHAGKTSKTPPVMVARGTIITFKGYPKPSLPLPRIHERPTTNAIATMVVQETADADAHALRKARVQYTGRLRRNIDDPGSSYIETDPQPIQDAEEPTRRMAPRIRSQMPALPTTSRITRSRGPAASVANIPKVLLTSDWMGDAIQVYKSGRDPMTGTHVDTVDARPMRTARQADGDGAKGLPDCKPSGQIQPLEAAPRPAGKRKRGVAASPAMCNVEAAAQLGTGDAATQPVKQPVAKRARMRQQAATQRQPLKTIPETAETDTAVTGEHLAPSPSPTASPAITRRSARTRLAPTRLDLGRDTPQLKPSHVPRSRLVVIKGRKYTPDALEKICIDNAPHLAVAITAVIPTALVLTKNRTRRAPTPLEGVTKKLRVQPPWRAGTLSGLPTRRIRLRKQALVFYTSLTWEALNTLLEDAGQYCCDPSQLLQDELDLAAHYEEEKEEEKGMQKVWYRKEYSDPEKRRMPCVGFYPKPVMGKTERLTAAEMRQDMKVFKDGKAEMDAMESELMDRYARILLDPFTGV